VHPIEHLRYVARARGTEPAFLAREAATALATLRADHANLVVASRRIVERHPEVAQLWWLCARLLVAADPTAEAWRLAERLDDDRVTDQLANALPADATVVTIGNPIATSAALARRADLTIWCADSEFGASDLLRFLDRFEIDAEPISTESIGRAVTAADGVLVEASAVSGERVLAPVGSQVVAAVARSAGTPVWLVVPTGTRLPAQYVDEIARRTLSDDWSGSIDEVAIDLVDMVVSETGTVPTSEVALRPDCPFAPELLRPGLP
jgi:translation initiation factor 2B subunit (eIF-2B alpha/beta/delta family)